MSGEAKTSKAFLVERYWPGVTWQQMRAGADRLSAATATGAVRYLRSTLVSDDSVVFCVFEAPCADDVATINTQADVRFDRIVACTTVYDRDANEIRHTA